MPPIRRYLRITQYSVLECRIYLDKPADAHRWLLNERSPVLPRVIESVRPLVLPKLREENAKAKSGKGGKRKGWKDVVVEDDFEVVVFLTETSSRHAIMHKEKQAKSEKPRLGSGSAKMTGEGTQDLPVELVDPTESVIRSEESQEAKITDLTAIPAASDKDSPVATASDEAASDPTSSRSSPNETEASPLRKGSKRSRVTPASHDVEPDDKKKLSLRTKYDGFSIYGRILCLVVKRRGSARSQDRAGGAGQAMMEEWIASTQVGDAQMDD
ncbi:MAG: hypothetical protein Q9219_006632 [cf. Caloplaca sp. 3 TL-2023]